MFQVLLAFAPNGGIPGEFWKRRWREEVDEEKRREEDEGRRKEVGRRKEEERK